VRRPDFLFDLHVHTPFSDGQVDIDTMLKTLIKLNVKVVGFADHIFPGAMYKHPPSIGMLQGLRNCYNSEFLTYRKAFIKILSRKYPQIAILNGGEIDILPQGKLALPKGIEPDFFRDAGSYLMVVKHHTFPKQFNFLWKKRPELERWMWTHNPRLLLNTHLWEKESYEAFRRYRPDIFAHPQENTPKYLSEYRIRRMMCNLKKFGVAFELNHFTKRGTRDDRILKWGEKYGVEFSVGSDFHGFQKDYEKLFGEGLEMFDLARDWNLKLLNPQKFLQSRIKLD
jgi:histidinol phosphatase-like PHP family hydrolase